MKRTTPRIVLLILFLALCTVMLDSNCGPRRNPNEKRYDLKGKVVAVNKSERTATIAHEDIKGYMPAMTMPFKIKNDADLELLNPGDQVTATLMVDDVSSWIEVTSIVEDAAPIEQAVSVPTSPKAGESVPDLS